MEPNTNNVPTPTTPLVEPALTNPTSAHGWLAVVSMILGILALLNSLFIMGAVFGIAAIIIGTLAIKKRRGVKRFAKAGIIMGGIGAILGITMTALFMAGVFGNFLPSFTPEPETTEPTAGEMRAKTLIDSKKSFKKGETARFGFVDIVATSAQGGYTSTALEADEEYVVVNITITNKDTNSQGIQNYLTLKHNNTVYKQSGKIASPISTEQMQPGESLTGNLIFKVKKADGTPTMKLQYTQEDVSDTLTGKGQRLIWLLEL